MIPADADPGSLGCPADLAHGHLIALIEKNWSRNRDIPPDQVDRAVAQAIADSRRRLQS